MVIRKTHTQGENNQYALGQQTLCCVIKVVKDDKNKLSESICREKFDFQAQCGKIFLEHWVMFLMKPSNGYNVPSVTDCAYVGWHMEICIPAKFLIVSLPTHPYIIPAKGGV